MSAAEVSQIIVRNARARQVAAHAAASDPTNPAIQAAAAQAFAHAGDYDQSVAHWKRASTLAPANGAMALGLGKALEMTGDLAGAKAAFRRAIASEPNNADAYYALTHIERQTPLNYLLAGLILRALPNARIVCLVRDPMDACLSLYRQMFLTDKPYYNFNYDLANTARAYALHMRLLAHWREVLPSDRYLEVRYEDVVADLEREARQMVAFCGLDWDARCLSFHENPTAIATPSAIQVRQPLYASSVGRWKTYGALLDSARAVLEGAGLEIV